MHSALKDRLPALPPQLVPAFGEEIADQPKVVGQDIPIDFRQIPTWKVGMTAIHKCGVITHFLREWTKQMSNPLLVLNIDVKVAHHHNPAVGANALLSPTELARLHIPLHAVHAVLMIEGDSGDLVKAHHVILANQSTLATGVVDIRDQLLKPAVLLRQLLQYRGDLRFGQLALLHSPLLPGGLSS